MAMVFRPGLRCALRTVCRLTAGSCSDLQLLAMGNWPPYAPPFVSAAGGDHDAHVAWGVAYSRFYEITEYRVTSNPPADGQPVVVTQGLQARVPNLDNGTAYLFSVKAVNASGEGPPMVSTHSVMPSEPVQLLPIPRGSKKL